MEAELILVTKEEATERPVGKARDEPEPLEAPKYANSPKFSFSNHYASNMHSFDVLEAC